MGEKIKTAIAEWLDDEHGEYLVDYSSIHEESETEWAVYAKDITDIERDVVIKCLVIDGYVANVYADWRKWYAVMEDHDADDCGNGSFDIDEAKERCRRYPDGYIAVIEGELCVEEIEQSDF